MSHIRAIRKARKEAVVVTAATIWMKVMVEECYLQSVTPFGDNGAGQELWFNSSRLDWQRDWVEVLTTRTMVVEGGYINRYGRRVYVARLNNNTQEGYRLEFALRDEK